MDLPVCLIEGRTDGKLQVNAEAIGILSRIRQPVVVVAIVGLYRTGKSYLMNKLAGSQKGFAVGSTVQAQTRGIWMRCLPHPTKEGLTLVLLDTEGLGDVEKGDKKSDTWIFCLAVLLSSALVYNSKNVIDEYAIEKLHYVAELAELIKVQSGDDDIDEAEYSRHFPIFIWALRDVMLKLEHNGKPITEDEYLEDAMTLKKGNSQKTLETVNKHNKYKDCIRMYFKTRKCFMFDLPSGDKNVFQNMDKVSEDQLNQDFLKNVKKFCDYIYNKAEVKCVDDIHQVTGEILANLVTMYTEAICSSNAACVEDVVTNVSVVENTRAVEEATQYYVEKMKEEVIFPTETLVQIIEISEECEKEALKIFMKRSFKDNKRHFLKKFMKNIDQKKSEFFEKNDAESRKHCEKLIKKLSKDLKKSLKEDSYLRSGGYKMFTDEMEGIEEKYKNEPRKGTKAMEVFQEFKKSKTKKAIKIMKKDEALSHQQKKLEEEKKKTELLDVEKIMKKCIESAEIEKKELEKKIKEKSFKEIVKMEGNQRRLRQDKLQTVIRSMERERDTYNSQGFMEYGRKSQTFIDKLEKKKVAIFAVAWVVLLGLAIGVMVVRPTAAPMVATVIAAGVGLLTG
ncbi:guanylate-binding protein 1-like [Engystomops pustulosus]|uniref:guanylate-binding protein 1-like n=1 Tax=Engystomops pustulosus TaxID=76066 RepID=UPI003AFB4BF8